MPLLEFPKLGNEIVVSGTGDLGLSRMWQG